MQSINNSVRLTGNLGNDVELVTLENGSKVAKVSIATNYFYKNAKGERIQDVNWHNLEAWNKTAELMEQLLKKGSHVTLEGMLKNDSYKTDSGDVRYVTKVKVNAFQLLTKKEEAVPF